MKKVLPYILVGLIALGVGAGATYYFVTQKDNQNSSNNEVDNKPEKEEKNLVVSESDLKNKILPLIGSTHYSRVYQNKKVTANDLADDLKAIGAIAYVALNEEQEISTKEVDGKTEYSITLDTIKKYSKKLYGSELKLNDPPEALCKIRELSCSLLLEEKSKNSYTFDLEFYASGSKPATIFESNGVTDVIYEKMETSEHEIYVYDKMIVNSEFDWSSEGSAKFSKLDGSGEVTINPFAEAIENIYKKYPDYFTRFKHTFKANDDGSYTYISSEPLVD